MQATTGSNSPDGDVQGSLISMSCTQNMENLAHHSSVLVNCTRDYDIGQCMSAHRLQDCHSLWLGGMSSAFAEMSAKMDCAGRATVKSAWPAVARIQTSFSTAAHFGYSLGTHPLSPDRERLSL